MVWKCENHRLTREKRESHIRFGGKGYGRELKLLLLLCCNKVAVCVASFSSAHRHTVCTSQDQRHASSTASEWKWKQKTVFSYFHSSEFQFPSSHNIYICCLSSLRKRLRPGGKQIKISRSKAASSRELRLTEPAFSLFCHALCWCAREWKVESVHDGKREREMKCESKEIHSDFLIFINLVRRSQLFK